MDELISALASRDIPATPQRLAVAQFVLHTGDHPTAEEVWAAVRQTCPTISRATVYNTLNLLVERGLLRARPLRAGTMTFDPGLDEHHHFIDEESGEVRDIPWEAIRISGHEALAGLEVRDFQVILRGRRTAG